MIEQLTKLKDIKKVVIEDIEGAFSVQNLLERLEYMVENWGCLRPQKRS